MRMPPALSLASTDEVALEGKGTPLKLVDTDSLALEHLLVASRPKAMVVILLPQQAAMGTRKAATAVVMVTVPRSQVPMDSSTACPSNNSNPLFPSNSIRHKLPRSQRQSLQSRSQSQRR